MKTTLKNRIISALLALAMLASFLPAGLIPQAQAHDFPYSSLKIEPDGSWEASFWGLDKTVTTNANWWFALIPDISNSASEYSIYNQIKGIHKGDISDQQIGAFQTSIQKIGVDLST